MEKPVFGLFVDIADTTEKVFKFLPVVHTIKWYKHLHISTIQTVLFSLIVWCFFGNVPKMQLSTTFC